MTDLNKTKTTTLASLSKVKLKQKDLFTGRIVWVCSPLGDVFKGCVTMKEHASTKHGTRFYTTITREDGSGIYYCQNGAFFNTDEICRVFTKEKHARAASAFILYISEKPAPRIKGFFLNVNGDRVDLRSVDFLTCAITETKWY